MSLDLDLKCFCLVNIILQWFNINFKPKMNNCPSLKQTTLQRIAGQILNNSGNLSLENKYHCKLVDKKFENISKCVQTLELPKELIVELIITTKSMKIEVFKWIVFLFNHYPITGLNLEIICFNHQGRLDQEKSIRFLIKNRKLNIRDQYILSCIYCLEDDLTILWYKMSSHYKKKFIKKAINSPINQYLDLVTLWTSKLLGKFQNSAPDDFSSKGFGLAIQTNNLAAVGHFWEIMSTAWKIEFLEDSEKLLSQTFLTSNHRTYYADIFYLLFSQMNERQQLNLLKCDAGVNKTVSRVPVCRCFLEWPYQKYFIQTINQLWNFLPLQYYFYLIKTILMKIARRKEDYDYHSLISEFWSLSPDNYKSCLRRKSFSFDPFQKLFNISDFVSSDAEVIICFVENASVEEKEILRFDIHGRDLCCRLFKELKWELVELLIRKCISSEEIMRKFKQDIIISIHEGFWFNNFISQNRLKEHASFIDWCLLSAKEDTKKGSIFKKKNESKVFEKDLYKYRLKLIKKYFHLCSLYIQVMSETTEEVKSKELERKNKFLVESRVSWCFTSKQELNNFKRDLYYDLKNSYNLEIFKYILKYRNEEFQNFITHCLSEDESKQFKKCLICYVKKNMYQNLNYYINIEVIQSFITWCDCSEKLKIKTKSVLHFEMNQMNFQNLTSNEKIASTVSSVCHLLTTTIKPENIHADLLQYAVPPLSYHCYYYECLDKYNGYFANNISLITERTNEQMDKFVNWCLSTEEEIGMYKANILDSVYNDKIVQSVIYYRCHNPVVLDRFISWCSPADEGLQFKRKVLYSMKDEFLDGINEYKLEYINRMISWCLSTVEEITTFKKELIFSLQKKPNFKSLINPNGLKWIANITNLFFSSDEEKCKFITDLIHSMKHDSEFIKLKFDDKIDLIDNFLVMNLSCKDDIDKCKEEWFYFIKNSENKSLVQLNNNVKKSRLDNFMKIVSL